MSTSVTEMLIGGRYRIERTIAEGGMARVYAATDVESGELVALKCLIPSLDKNATPLFLREARTAGAIDHPNVVRVLDVGVHEGAPFFAMELLSGRPLSEHFDGSPMPAPRLVALLLPALRGVRAAHQRGLVHRDLKPANLFVCDDGVTKVLDFGIAKARGDGLELRTASGVITGTAHYLAPEQVRAERDLDARTDIYAIGVILYEGLTGRRPFDAPTFTALAIEIATGPMPRPSLIVPQLNRQLETIVLRALARSRDVRFPDVETLAGELEPFA